MKREERGDHGWHFGWGPQFIGASSQAEKGLDGNRIVEYGGKKKNGGNQSRVSNSLKANEATHRGERLTRKDRECIFEP